MEEFYNRVNTTEKRIRDPGTKTKELYLEYAAER